MALSQALKELMREKVHIAIVMSQDQKIVGMITLEDIIEDLVGEIEDEFDRLPNYIQPVGSGWIAGGAAPMTTVASTVGVELVLENILDRTPNLAEWVVQKIGREVDAGEVLTIEDLSVTVRKLRRKKLAEAFISKISLQ
jgi:putative hemolysin